MEGLILFSANFCYVFLMGFQTKTVAMSNFKTAFFVSILISVGSFINIKTAANNDLLYYLYTSGFGGAVGIVCAIIIHDKFNHNRGIKT